MTGRLAVLASGSGTNLQALLDACADGVIAADVVLVVVNRSHTGALTRARAAAVPVREHLLGPYRDDGRGRRIYDADLAELVAQSEPDWIVLAGWMHLLSSAFLDRFPDRVVNLHPALPGEFPGAHAIDDAWRAHQLAGLDRTGVMVHLVPDEGVDDGPVLATAEVPIEANDERDHLEARVHQVEHDLLVRVVGDLVAGRIVP